MNTMNIKKPVTLVILDGFGYAKQKEYNAIAQAHMPHFNTWFSHYPHTLLKASGAAAGLLKEQAGNSEVGHITIGCGRIIPQPIKIIHDSIDNKSFFTLPILQKQFKKLKKNNGTLHIMGLLSDGGVHSHEKHLYAFIETAIQNNIHDIVIHAFLDGRDTPAQSAYTYLERLEKKLKEYGYGTIGSLHGRFYAMDRDRNGERTQKTYDILTCPITDQNIPTTQSMTDWRSVLQKNYENNITDEYIEPTLLNQECRIKPNDGIIFYNFRPDRAHQLASVFIDSTHMHTDAYIHKKQLPLSFFITPVPYTQEVKTTILFDIPVINNTLKEVLCRAGKTIFSIAESEKYAHVTYFFAGYREQPFATETRHLIPSLHTQNYAQHPKMSALKITRAVVQSLTHNPHDFYLINYANADMVGHSGNFNATIKAVECLDKQLHILYDHIVKKMGGTLCITADHGKAENMFDPVTKQPIMAHTTNDVPFIVIQQQPIHMPLSLTKLSDIAPFILTLMKLGVPAEMEPEK
ncbi:MAG: 2,3-bisphosphoglycerate-independent phosphoglycerate mutase [Candidatus Dependentiae bacterium]|nr:2,3-bisphosphoglycerate-independent phosphoglycerate mutase [Candidatus Dependentiae bacterium]